MSQPLKIAVAGLGRIGAIHALHAHELSSETPDCELVAVAESDTARARRFTEQVNRELRVFTSLEALAEARICDAAVIATPTGKHWQDAATLIAAGYRVLLEKPLTGALETDRQFAAELDRNHPQALMLALQRRFDAPLQYVKELVDSAAIGRIFKIYSALEDSNPAPEGYESGGILPDMSVHNVDEILWLTGRTPRAAMVIASRIYGYRLPTFDEDFDDALLYLWFDSEMVAQVQVSRNHVSGYRVETIIFGEEGHIHIGRFEQKPFEVLVEAYGRSGRAERIAYRSFPMRDYGRPQPEFADRFGPAYKAELRTFIDCCRKHAPFPTTHRDGVRAQAVISAGMNAVIQSEQTAPVESA